MREIEKIVTYKTTDGQLFDVYSNAVIHQEILDGIKKGCNTCLNSGKVLKEEYLHQYGRNYTVLKDCKKCNGKGYIE